MSAYTLFVIPQLRLPTSSSHAGRVAYWRKMLRRKSAPRRRGTETRTLVESLDTQPPMRSRRSSSTRLWLAMKAHGSAPPQVGDVVAAEHVMPGRRVALQVPALPAERPSHPASAHRKVLSSMYPVGGRGWCSVARAGEPGRRRPPAPGGSPTRGRIRDGTRSGRRPARARWGLELLALWGRRPPTVGDAGAALPGSGQNGPPCWPVARSRNTCCSGRASRKTPPGGEEKAFHLLLGPGLGEGPQLVRTLLRIVNGL